MILPQLQGVILAAGRSTRFKTNNTKLSYTVCGQEMVLYPAKLLASMNVPMTFIVGYHKETVQSIVERARIPGVSFIEQTEQRGTGHAVLCSRSEWHTDHILVLNGDVPLITKELIENLAHQHVTTGAAVSLVVSHFDSLESGYGRIVHTKDSVKIVEARDFIRDYANDTSEYPWINAGIYLFERNFLEQTLPALPINQRANELYLTDMIHAASEQKKIITTVPAAYDLVRGVNTLKELWTVEHIKRSEIISRWMDAGVRFSAAHNAYVDLDVEIGAGTFIGAGVLLMRGTHIGTNCWIDAFSCITNSVIHDNARIMPHSVITNSEIGAHATIGPFAHLHDNAVIATPSIKTFDDHLHSHR